MLNIVLLMLLLIKKIGVIFSVLSEIESLELEFLDLIDTQPNLIKEFSEWLTATVEQNNALMMKNVSNEDKKKLAKAKKSEKNF